MTKEEYNELMQKLANNMAIVEEGIKSSSYIPSENSWNESEVDSKSYLLDSPTPLDAIDMASRCVSRNERIPKEIKESPEFKENVIRTVMSSVKNCELNSRRDAMLKAVEYSPIALEYVSDRLKDDPTFLLDAIKANKEVANQDIVKEFYKENPGFRKQVDKIVGKEDREGKEQKLAKLIKEDTELANEVIELSKGTNEIGREND